MDQSFKPTIVKDLDVWELFKIKKESIYCIGSKSLDRYIEVKNNKDFIYNFCKILNGKYTIQQLIEVYKKKNNSFDVEKMIDILIRSGLIVNVENKYVEKSEMDKLSCTFFEVNLEKKSNFFKKACKIIFPYVFCLTIIMNIIAIFYCIINYKIFFNLNIYEMRNSYDFSIIIIAIALSICLMLHETSHGIVAYKYGLKPQKAVFSLYLMVSLMAYLKIPGIYTLKPKKRILVWSAGMYTNLCLASIFMLLYFFTNFNGNEIFYTIGFTNLICITMSLSPFMPTDGYFIMTTILKSPNMRKDITSGKLKIIDKNNLIKSIYLIFTVIIMSTLLVTQFKFVIQSVVDAYKCNIGIWNFIIRIKIFILIILMVIIKSVLKYKKKKVAT